MRAHLIVALGIVVGVGIGALSPNMVVLRAGYIVLAMIAIAEILAALGARSSSAKKGVIPCIVAGVVLGGSVVAVVSMPGILLLLAITAAFFADGGAYVSGAAIGHQLFDEAPFPILSPKKTYEGLFGGFFGTAGAILICALILGYVPVPVQNGEPEVLARSYTAVCLMGGGLIAILGDLMGSAVKRRLGIKDSCDVLGSVSGFGLIEKLWGGPEGCGGYLDRLDSTSAVICYTAAVYFLIKNLGV